MKIGAILAERSRVVAVIAGLLLAAPLACAQAQATAADRDDARWVLTSLLSYSTLDNGRGDWRGAELDLLYKVSPRLRVGGNVELRERGDQADTLYTASVSANPVAAWEWHAALTVTPNADFSAERIGSAGAEWRVSPRISLLLDYRQLRFASGNLREIRPGVILWFGDQTWVTARYTEGDAFGDAGYHAHLLRLDHVFAGERRLTLAYARGIDPERDPLLPGVLLTESNLFAAVYRFPVRPQLDLVLGADYEDREPYYTRTGLLVGVSTRF